MDNIGLRSAKSDTRELRGLEIRAPKAQKHENRAEERKGRELSPEYRARVQSAKLGETITPRQRGKM